MQLFASPAQQIQGTPGTNPRRWGETWPPQWSAFDARFDNGCDGCDATEKRGSSQLMVLHFFNVCRLRQEETPRKNFMEIFRGQKLVQPIVQPGWKRDRKKCWDIGHWRGHLGAQWWWTPAEKDILVHQMLEIAYFKQTQGIPRDSRMQAWVKNYIPMVLRHPELGVNFFNPFPIISTYRKKWASTNRNIV